MWCRGKLESIPTVNSCFINNCGKVHSSLRSREGGNLVEGVRTKLRLEQGYVSISYDSSSAIQLSKNPKFYERTKHVDIMLHFIKDEIAQEVVNVVKIPFEHNVADILTKPLPSVKFKASLNLIGVVSF